MLILKANALQLQEQKKKALIAPVYVAEFEKEAMGLGPAASFLEFVR